MNDTRRKEIHRAVALISEAKGILETVLAGEQNDSFHCTPVSFRVARTTIVAA